MADTKLLSLKYLKRYFIQAFLLAMLLTEDIVRAFIDLFSQVDIREMTLK